MIISEMTVQECRALLSSSRVGRLACVWEGQPYVVPISFPCRPEDPGDAGTSSGLSGGR